MTSQMIEELVIHDKMKIKNLRITGPGEADLDSVYRILNSCERHLRSKGHTYWNNAYYMERIAGMMRTHDVRLVYDNDSSIAIATFTLSNRALFGSHVHWDAVKPQKAKYFSALGVMPEMQGKGIGSFLCSRVENIVEEQGHNTLRLNTAPPLRDYYKEKGFEEIYHIDRDGKIRFYLMEKRIR